MSALWKIYVRDREAAKEIGDPLLGIVEAFSKEQAEQHAQNGRWVHLDKEQPARVMNGVWAVPLRPITETISSTPETLYDAILNSLTDPPLSLEERAKVVARYVENFLAQRFSLATSRGNTLRLLFESIVGRKDADYEIPKAV